MSRVHGETSAMSKKKESSFESIANMSQRYHDNGAQQQTVAVISDPTVSTTTSHPGTTTSSAMQLGNDDSRQPLLALYTGVRGSLPQGIEMSQNNTKSQSPSKVLPRRKSDFHVRVSRNQLMDGVNLAHLFAETGDVRALQCILEDAPELLHKKTRKGWTPLHYASWSGKLDTVKFLVENGATEEADKWGWTPLHCATQHCHEGVCRFLCDDAGHSIFARDNVGTRPVDLVNDELLVSLGWKHDE